MKISLRKKLFIVIFVLVAMAVINFAVLSIFEFYKTRDGIYPCDIILTLLLSYGMITNVFIV